MAVVPANMDAMLSQIQIYTNRAELEEMEQQWTQNADAKVPVKTFRQAKVEAKGPTIMITMEWGGKTRGSGIPYIGGVLETFNKEGNAFVPVGTITPRFILFPVSIVAPQSGPKLPEPQSRVFKGALKNLLMIRGQRLQVFLKQPIDPVCFQLPYTVSNVSMKLNCKERTDQEGGNRHANNLQEVIDALNKSDNGDAPTGEILQYDPADPESVLGPLVDKLAKMSLSEIVATYQTPTPANNYLRQVIEMVYPTLCSYPGLPPDFYPNISLNGTRAGVQVNQAFPQQGAADKYDLCEVQPNVPVTSWMTTLLNLAAGKEHMGAVFLPVFAGSSSDRTGDVMGHHMKHVHEWGMIYKHVVEAEEDPADKDYYPHFYQVKKPPARFIKADLKVGFWLVLGDPQLKQLQDAGYQFAPVNAATPKEHYSTVYKTQQIYVTAHVHIAEHTLSAYFGPGLASNVDVWARVYQALLRGRAFFQGTIDNTLQASRPRMKLAPGCELTVDINVDQFYVDPESLAMTMGIPVTSATAVEAIASSTSGAGPAAAAAAASGLADTRFVDGNVFDFVSFTRNAADCQRCGYRFFAMGSTILPNPVVTMPESGSKILSFPGWTNGKTEFKIDDGGVARSFPPNVYPRNVDFKKAVLIFFAMKSAVPYYDNAIKIRQLCDRGGDFDSYSGRAIPFTCAVGALAGISQQQLADLVAGDDAPAAITDAPTAKRGKSDQ